VAAATATGLAACGGSGSDPSAVVKTYLSAVANGDGKTACDQLTQAAQNQAAAGGQRAGLGSSCAVFLSKAAGVIPAAAKDALKNAQVGGTNISGDGATVQVTIQSINRTRPLHLSKVGGRWLVNDANLVGGSSSGSTRSPSTTSPATPSTTTTP
jgi:hypothetical protein